MSKKSPTLVTTGLAPCAGRPIASVQRLSMEFLVPIDMSHGDAVCLARDVELFLQNRTELQRITGSLNR